MKTPSAARFEPAIVRTAACALLALAAFAPGARAASTGVVISEVYASGGLAPAAAWSNDYVVLYNLGATSQGLSGWSLQFPPPPAGGPWSVVLLSGSIAPGHFYLVRLASDGAVGAALPTPDASGTFDLNPAGGVVALLSTTAAVMAACPSGAPYVDLVGYGVAQCSETAPTVTPDGMNAIIRAVPCVDTDNNAADFLSVAASPENSANVYSCANHPPTIQPIPNQVLAEGSVVTVPSVANDLDSNPLTFSGSGPAWFTVNPSTGLCTLSPDLSAAEVNGGVYNASVTASDGLSYAQRAFTITVTDLTTSANLPFSGMWPGGVGGVNMGTGELWVTVLQKGVNFHGSDPFQADAFPRGSELLSSRGSSGGISVGQGEFPTPYLSGSAAYRLGSGLPLPLHYGTLIAREGLAQGHFGTNWLGTYDWRMFTDAGGIIVVCDNMGEVMHFQPSPVGGPATQLNHLEERLVLAPTPSGTAMRLYRSSSDQVFELDVATGRLNRIFDSHGNSLTCAYGPAGFLSTVSDGVGHTLTFTNDVSGNVTAITDGIRTVIYGYTSTLLTTFTDAAGKVTHYAYAAGAIPGLLASITEPDGNTPATYAYDAKGRVIGCTDALAHTWNYSYGPGIESAMTEPGGEVSHAVLDRPLHLTSITDALGRTTSMTYDASGRPASVTRALGDVTTVGYDATSGFVNDIGLADGNHVTGTFSAQVFDLFTHYLPASTHFPDGATESCGYDASGNLTSFTDRLGKVWSSTFNAHGQVVSKTNSTGGVLSWTYDARLNPITFTDDPGNVTGGSYDAEDQLVTLTDPDATTISMTHDAVGRLLSYTDESGNVSAGTYDANGNLISSTDPLGHTDTYAYDAQDRLITDTDPLGATEQFAFDVNGRLLSTTDRSGRTTTLARDAAGEVTSLTDNGGHVTSLSYDANGRLAKTTDPLGHSVLLSDDVRDRVTQFTDPLGDVTTYGYDAMSRLTSLAAPLGHTESYGYDARGSLISQLDVFAQTRFTRNALGEATAIQDPNGNSWTGTVDRSGRPLSGADPLGRSTTCTFDANSCIQHVADPVGTIDFTRDLVGRITGVNCSGGPALGMTYDAAGRLTSATGATFAYDNADRMTSCNGITMTRDPDGRMSGETFEAGKTVTFSYNSAGLLSQVTDWLAGVTSFSYDAANRITGMTRANGTSASYAYDAAGRLTSWNESKPGPINLGGATLTLDALGRVTSAARTVPLMATAVPDSEPYTYDGAGQTGGGTWSARRELLSFGARSFVWDGVGNLTSYHSGAENPSFAYDASGNEITRTDAAGVQHFVWNDAMPSLAMINPGTAGEIIIVCTPDGTPLYQADSTGARTFYHFDEIGNLSFVTNDAAAIVASFAYSPTGQVTTSGSAAVANSVPFKFGGASDAITEGASGLVRFGTSVWDPTLGRVISGSGDPTSPPGIPMPYPNVTDPSTAGQYANVGNSLDGVYIGPAEFQTLALMPSVSNMLTGMIGDQMAGVVSSAKKGEDGTQRGNVAAAWDLAQGAAARGKPNGAGGSAGFPSQSVSISYEEVKFEYYAQRTTTPDLHGKLATGVHIKAPIITSRKSDSGTRYMVIKMQEAMISRVGGVPINGVPITGDPAGFVSERHISSNDFHFVHTNDQSTPVLARFGPSGCWPRPPIGNPYANAMIRPPMMGLLLAMAIAK